MKANAGHSLGVPASGARHRQVQLLDRSRQLDTEPSCSRLVADRCLPSGRQPQCVGHWCPNGVDAVRYPRDCPASDQGDSRESETPAARASCRVMTPQLGRARSASRSICCTRAPWPLGPVHLDANFHGCGQVASWPTYVRPPAGVPRESCNPATGTLRGCLLRRRHRLRSALPSRLCAGLHRQVGSRYVGCQHAAIEEAAAVDALLADVVTGVRSVPPLVVAGVDTDVERVAADSWKTRSPGLSWLRLRCWIS